MDIWKQKNGISKIKKQKERELGLSQEQLFVVRYIAPEIIAISDFIVILFHLIYVTLDHKTSLKCLLFLIEILDK